MSTTHGLSFPATTLSTTTPTTHSSWAEEGPLTLLVPLIAVLPFAASYVLDRTGGYLRHVLVRSSYRRYFLAKFVANLLAGGLAVALPLLLFYGFTNLTLPRGFPPVHESRIPFERLSGPLGYLYRPAPDLYIFFLIGVGFIFGATYLAVLWLEEWRPPVTFIPHDVNSTSWLTVFGQLGGVFAVSVICLWVLARKDRVYA